MSMPRMLALTASVVLLASGCSKRVLVEVPPRVDLHSYDVVGVVEFASDAEDDAGQLTTQRFIESLQEAQPGVRVLELGSEEQLQARLAPEDRDRMPQAIGEHFDVDVVILGQLTMSEVKPKFELTSMMRSVNASAEVDASLTARMVDTTRGATLWTRSSRDKRKVAEVGLNTRGSVRLDATDPDNAYAGMLDGLVVDLTRDFRSTYVRQ